MVDHELVINPDIQFNSDIAREHIGKALSLLHSEFFTHNDVRLDNVGYRPSDKKYILFDFDMVKSNSSDSDITRDIIHF